MTVIPAEALTAIEAVIVNDEGGWVLTSNANDPDGGWTFAGVTHKTFAEHCSDVSIDVMQASMAIPASLASLKQVVYEIYYEKYYRPLEQHFDNPTDYELSCAINCGVQTAVDCLGFCADKEEDKKIFLHKWLLHYAQLVRNNAEAWQKWAQLLYRHYLGDTDAIKEIEQHPELKPKLLRAETLAGWINRVERYR